MAAIVELTPCKFSTPGLHFRGKARYRIWLKQQSSVDLTHPKNHYLFL